MILPVFFVKLETVLAMEVSLKPANIYFSFFLTLRPYNLQIQFEKKLHVGHTYISFLLTTSGIINFVGL